MSSLSKLKKTKTLEDLAVLLGYKSSSIAYILYKIPVNEKYTTFTIPKKSGGSREIKAPTEKLKQLQRKLADLLNDCMIEIHGGEDSKLSISHGFRKNHSIATNANKHTTKRYVFNVDLENFFPSINFGRVRGFFMKDKRFLLPPKVATIVAQIACHENSLPQGSPCSPVISNLITHILDIHLIKLSKKYKVTYSRYADDLSFSTNLKNFPKQIACKKRNVWKIGKELKKTINEGGFLVNDLKTRMQYKKSRQVVTGLVVNKTVNVKPEYYKNVRAMCHSLFYRGHYHLPKDPKKHKRGKKRFAIKKLNLLNSLKNFFL